MANTGGAQEPIANQFQMFKKKSYLGRFLTSILLNSLERTKIFTEVVDEFRTH